MVAIVVCALACAVLGVVGWTESGNSGMRWLFAGILVLAGVQAVGAAIIAAGRRRAGALVALVASIPVVPLGFLGAWGARTVLDQVASEAFEERRRSHG